MAKINVQDRKLSTNSETLEIESGKDGSRTFTLLVTFLLTEYR